MFHRFHLSLNYTICGWYWKYKKKFFFDDFDDESAYSYKGAVRQQHVFHQKRL